ncbi:hypothetical protein DVH24_032951 [Malus domestica]|uniref:Uncharacterized protein n=1 Tax=Malus domestica TaxID=3750 RepID=A0A498IRH2_MALDO|nr:hypothetical protein DVH24_032951 [Malus domestica]
MVPLSSLQKPKQFQNHFYVSQNTVCISSSQIYSSHKHSYQQRKYQTQLLLQRLQPEMYKIPQAFLKPYLWLQNRIIRRNRDPQGHWWTTNCLVGFIKHISLSRAP